MLRSSRSRTPDENFACRIWTSGQARRPTAVSAIATARLPAATAAPGGGFGRRCRHPASEGPLAEVVVRVVLGS
jgi:hypothetical protein